MIERDVVVKREGEGRVIEKDAGYGRESVGCIIMSKLIHLFFNYQPGLVSLELTKNICEGSVDVFVTLECIYPYILSIVP